MSAPPYKVVRRLGHGAMAEVLLATLPVQGREATVALKRVLPMLENDPVVLELFREEARLASSLHHPHIPRVLAVSLHEHPYIAMEHVDGVDLGVVVHALAQRKGRMPVPVALHVGRAIAEALAYAHALVDQDGKNLEVVHRDVSPQNVLLSRQGEVKLIDFGIARTTQKQRRTKSGALLGKIGYMSPEQVLGRRADRRADVFSWGIVVHELLTGVHPVSGLSDHERMRAQASATFPDVRARAKEVPAAVAALLVKATAREPQDRWDGGGALLAALEDAWQEETGDDVVAGFLAEETRRGLPTAGRGDQSTLADEDRTLSDDDP